MSEAGAAARGAKATSGPPRRLALVAAGEDRAEIRSCLDSFDIEIIEGGADTLLQGMRDGSLATAVLDLDLLQQIACADLREALAGQPAWSLFWMVVIGSREAFEEAQERLSELSQVVFVERPVHPFLMASAVRSVLQARERQGQIGTYIEQRQGSEDQLRQLTSRLETRVRARMNELRAANERLIEEVRERKAAEERLRESEELYRYTVELSQQMVWTARPDGSERTINARFYEVTGLPPGKLPLDAVHPDDAEKVSRYWREAICAGQSLVNEFRMRVADGSYRYFRASAVPRRGPDGAIIRWYGTIEDVDEQRRSDAARQEAEERYRLAARATNDAIWDHDLRDNTIKWTASEEALFGYTGVDELTAGNWWRSRIHPDDVFRVVNSLDSTIAGTATHWSSSYRFRKADGSYADVFDQGFIIRDEKGMAVRAVGAMADVTEHSRAEAEIRQMQSELIHVSRVSAMGAMASTLAHELNQPLTAVSSYIRGTRRILEHEESEAVAQVQEALEAAENAALRAGKIVRRLRELVARGNVSSRPEELPKIIQDAGLIAFLDEHLLGATHRIELDPEAVWVEVDPIQIQQVLINLIRNALQAMEHRPKREVVITTSVISRGMIEVSVADTGIGLSAEVREALFSPFHSTKMEGLGIGLSISRTIIEAHGGKIWADNRPEGGAIFRFTLPRAEPEA